MARRAADLLKDALALEPEERAALAESLLESLDSGAEPANEEAWRAEIQRRLAEIDAGIVSLVPWEEAERRLWSKARR